MSMIALRSAIYLALRLGLCVVLAAAVAVVWHIIHHRHTNDTVVCNALIIVIIKSVRLAGTRCMGFSWTAVFFRLLSFSFGKLRLTFGHRKYQIMDG